MIYKIYELVYKNYFKYNYIFGRILYIFNNTHHNITPPRYFQLF
jgi:hypothetical protein